MYYCFIAEDLKTLRQDDPLILQRNYAEHLGLLCYCRLSDGVAVNQNGLSMDLAGQLVFLRGTCDAVPTALNLIEALGAIPVETADDTRKIEGWTQFPITSRPLIEANPSDIFGETNPKAVSTFLRDNPLIFVKSRAKGFTARIKTERLLQRDPELADFLTQWVTIASNGLILAPLLHIKQDSLGRRESRHIVLNGQLLNSSRPVHSIRHAVPQTHLAKARELVDKMAQLRDFPKSYVLDLGDFEELSGPDVVEINPISTSMCYVNNSIFDVVTPEVAVLQRKLGLGAEFCYDALIHPGRYASKRLSNVSYEYTGSEHYNFL